MLSEVPDHTRTPAAAHNSWAKRNMICGRHIGELVSYTTHWARKG